MNRVGRIWLVLALAVVLSSPDVPAGSLMNHAGCALAQDDSKPATQAAKELPAVPHGKFFVDYLLVALLIGGAVYAICRKSRRV